MYLYFVFPKNLARKQMNKNNLIFKFEFFKKFLLFLKNKKK
jgi:hypothetical protein